MQQTYAIIGLGRFGSSLLESLVAAGQEVLAIDKDPDTVEDYMDVATHAVIANAQEEDALKDLDLPSFDHVIVCIGHNQQASILTTILLKDLDCKDVIAKAETKLHARVLEKVGADLVVRPELEMAERLAENLMAPNLVSFIELGGGYSIAEIKVANLKYSNKSISDLHLDRPDGLHVVAIKSKDEVVMEPSVDKMVQIGDVLTVMGKTGDVQLFEESIAIEK